VKTGRVLLLVLGTILALLGLGLLAGAAGTGWANAQQRDGGYLTTPTERYQSPFYALTTQGLNIMADRSVPDVINDGAGRLLVQGSTESGKDLFIGIAPQAEAARYLDGVARSELRKIEFSPFDVDYRQISGTEAPQPPGEQTFWAASAQGSGTPRLEWDVQPGNWELVIMNGDASGQVTADLQAGFRSDLLWPLFLTLLISGIMLLAIGVPLIVAAAVGLGRHGPPAPHRGAQPVQAYAAPSAAPFSVEAPEGSPYPARLTGHLDAGLSRGMWLIKWFLAIPHVIILVFLWFALAVTTVVAGFAILFTGRYPPALFNFNVGVLRWNWRVAFYAFNALGTDKYPPFTLARTDYPADFDVDYPERLSRPLVLIKSWLLALPHLLVIAALTGTGRVWDSDGGEQTGYVQTGAISLLGLLVLIAGIILLFTGQYRKELFDLIIGLNRWIYRALTYIALLRDEYPPFRLDQGPDEPRLNPGPGPELVHPETGQPAHQSSASSGAGESLPPKGSP
jgi:hypothetical protein